MSTAKPNSNRLLALILMAFVAGLLCPTPADATTVNIVGLGATTCARFLGDIQTSPSLERDYFAWAQGYMSALLIRSPEGVDEDLDLAPPDFPLSRQAEFLRSFCLENTGADFSDGVKALYQTLRSVQRT